MELLRVFFNFDQGTNGVQFCDGATHVVAHIDGAGNATFAGRATIADLQIGEGSQFNRARRTTAAGHIIINPTGNNPLL